jgi:protein-S-isoprenylcysteine O-methyltransferase Ste14
MSSPRPDLSRSPRHGKSPARPSLARQAWRGQALFLVAMAVLLFAGAGSLRFWQGWVYYLTVAITSTAIAAYFLRHDPKLVERRLAVGATAEQEPNQKIIMALTSVCFVLLILIPALDARWHWSDVPVWLVLVGDVCVFASFGLVFFVLKSNSYAAATIRVEADQPVISTGAYAFVRHPMYAGALPMLVLTPLALGSYWGLLVGIVLVPALIWRLLDEERVLTRDLPGYAAYCQTVRWRLIPYVW